MEILRRLAIVLSLPLLLAGFVVGFVTRPVVQGFQSGAAAFELLCFREFEEDEKT